MVNQNPIKMYPQINQKMFNQIRTIKIFKQPNKTIMKAVLGHYQPELPRAQPMFYVTQCHYVMTHGHYVMTHGHKQHILVNLANGLYM